MVKLKTLALLSLLIPSTVFAIETAVVEETQVPCWNAIMGTLLHYAVGDGATDGCIVEYIGGNIEGGVPPAGGIQCTLPGGFDTITCALWGEYCPTMPDPGDPHNTPGVARCSGCQTSSGMPVTEVSINEAKCCLKTGRTTSPLCG